MITFCATGDMLIHKPVPEHHPGTDALAAQIQTADVRITNLETTISHYDCYASTFSGGTPLTADPAVLEDVKRYGFQICGCANNHSLDFSFGGVESTIRHLDAAGLKHAGIGMSLHEASSPASLDTKDGKVAFFAQTAVYSGNDSGRAGESHDGIKPRPGVNGLRHIDECLVTAEQMAYLRDLAYHTMVNAEEEVERDFGYQTPAPEDTFRFGEVKFRLADTTGKTSRCHEKDIARTEHYIREACKTHAYVVASIHSHQFPARKEYETDHYVEEFAHRCIDAGASAVVGSGNHLLKGIEIYKGKPIFYCLGNFMFHAEYVTRISADVVDKLGFPQEMTGAEVVAARKARAKAAMETQKIYYQSCVPFWSMENGELKEIKLLPIALGAEEPFGLRGYPSPAKPETILSHLQMACQPYGTKLETDGKFIKVTWEKENKL